MGSLGSSWGEGQGASPWAQNWGDGQERMHKCGQQPWLLTHKPGLCDSFSSLSPFLWPADHGKPN